jgi:hypothetical protein
MRQSAKTIHVFIKKIKWKTLHHIRTPGYHVSWFVVYLKLTVQGLFIQLKILLFIALFNVCSLSLVLGSHNPCQTAGGPQETEDKELRHRIQNTGYRESTKGKIVSRGI